MTSSIRCSGRSRALLAALVAAAAASGCGHPAAARAPRLGPVDPAARPRVVLLPLDDLSGASAPVKELLGAMERAVGARLELVPRDELEPFLARHRIRHTGGIDRAGARAAREELGASAIIVTSVTMYAETPPVLGLIARLVSTADQPEILWMEGAGWAGDQAPGLLGLGRMESMPPVRERVLTQLTRSLDAFLAGAPRDDLCDGRRHRPKVRYRSRELDSADRRTLAVVPFLDLTQRVGAGEVVALEFVRQLVANGRYRVLEPGVVRDYLLRARVLIPGGVSLEATRLIVGGLEAQLVLSGLVLDFDEATAGGSAIRFRATLLDASDGDVLWSSSSFSRADDGVFLFGLGRVGNPQDLACRMVAGVMDRLPRRGGTPVAWEKRDDAVRSFLGTARDERAAGRSGAAGR